MARRRKFREVERGWLNILGQETLSFTDVDNVVTNWDTIISGEELLGDTDEPFVGEQNVDFWIERAAVWYNVARTATLPAGNTTRRAYVWVGLAVVSNAVANKIDIPLGLTTSGFFADIWREADVVRGVKRVALHVWGEPNTNDETYFPSWLEPQKFELQNLFLKRDDSLIFVMSQTGVDDTWPGWIAGQNSAQVYQAALLIRKKRGR